MLCRARATSLRYCSRSDYNFSLFSFQLVLLTIVLLAAFGNDGIRLTFGQADFLGVGISFTLAITVPLIFIAYLCGGNLFVLVISLLQSAKNSSSVVPLTNNSCVKLDEVAKPY